MPSTQSKRKKAARTPQEEADFKAQELISLREARAALDEREAELVADLRAYVNESGQTSFTGCEAYRRANPVKLVGSNLTTKELDMAKEQLCKELPNYTKLSLDVSRMFNSTKTDLVLQNALVVKGLSLEQTTEWHFKAR